MNESCHTYEWVMPHIWMSHVTHINKSCHTYEWVMSHIWMSHVTHINEAYHIDVNESCDVYVSESIHTHTNATRLHLQQGARRLLCCRMRLWTHHVIFECYKWMSHVWMIQMNDTNEFTHLICKYRCVNTLKMTCMSATLESTDEICIYTQNDSMCIQNDVRTWCVKITSSK